MNVSLHIGADPATIERDIDATRARVDQVLDALQAKLSPRQLGAQARHFIQDRSVRLLRRVGRDVRDNPWPVAVGVLLAVGWIVLANRGNTRPSRRRS